MDDKKWVIQIKNILKGETEDKLNTLACIFQIPSSISQTKPDAYTPQVIALGPYHHLRTKPYQMENCKLDFALKAQQTFGVMDFEEVYKALEDKIVDIRACYDWQNLAMGDDTFLCIMAVDILFLLQLLFFFEVLLQLLENEKSEADNMIATQPLSRMVEIASLEWSETSEQAALNMRQADAEIDNDDEEVADDDEVVEKELNTPQNIENNEPLKFIDAANKEHSMEEILSDIVMLENQIPTIALKAIVIKSRSPPDVDRNLVILCLRLSPIMLYGNSPPDDVDKNYHLLDALYRLVWFGMEIRQFMFFGAFFKTEQKAPSDSEIWSKFWSYFKQLNIGPLSVFAAVVDLILNSLKVLGISVSLDFSEDEVLVPSASELKRFGVKFLPLGSGGIKDISFDDKQLTLKLPVLNYNVKLTEVVIRNLLAYEALANPECPKFGSFIELMCSLIRSIEDVEVLKVAKVVPSDVEGLKAKELVKLLDELVSSNPSKSKSKASSEHEQAQEHTDNRPKVIKDAIDGVNKYYNNRKEVRTRKIIKNYLSVSWKVLTVLALVLLLVLMALQTFCSFYGCSKIFKDELRSTLMGWI